MVFFFTPFTTVNVKFFITILNKLEYGDVNFVYININPFKSWVVCGVHSTLSLIKGVNCAFF
ncbi:hypothetical protein GCM10009347_17050 [Shewanella algicola]|nr:hypothetical protein GCM10009347_17050 [Shewanella algicola]